MLSTALAPSRVTEITRLPDLAAVPAMISLHDVAGVYVDTVNSRDPVSLSFSALMRRSASDCPETRWGLLILVSIASIAAMVIVHLLAQKPGTATKTFFYFGQLVSQLCGLTN